MNLNLQMMRHGSLTLPRTGLIWTGPVDSIGLSVKRMAYPSNPPHVAMVGAGQTYATIQSAVNAIPSGTAGNNSFVVLCADSAGGSKTFTEKVVSAKDYVTIANRPGDIITISSSGLSGNTIDFSHTGCELMSVNSDGIADIGYLTIKDGVINYRAVTGDYCRAWFVTFDDAAQSHFAINTLLICNGCLIKDSTGASSGAVIDLNASTGILQLNFPIIAPSKDTYNAESIMIRSGSVAVNNGVVYGTKAGFASMFPNANVKNLTIKNTAFSGVCTENYSSIITNASTGGETVTVANSMLCRAYKTPTTEFFSGGYTDGGGNLSGVLPGFSSNRLPSIVCFELDDAINSANMESLVVLLAPFGWKATWNIDTLSMTAPRWELARSLVANGHDVCSHGRRHVDVSNTKSFNLQAVAAGVTATISAGVLSISNGDSFTLVNYASINLLVAAILATGRYSTCAIDSSAYGGDTSTASLYVGAASPITLAPVSGVDISTTARLFSHDQTAYIAEEIGGSKIDIETNIPGHTVTGYACPGNYWSSTLSAGAVALGYTSVRASTAPVESMFAASGYDLGKINCVFIDDLESSSESELKEIAAATLSGYGVLGVGAIFFTHAVSWPFWEALLNLLSESGVSISTRKGLEDYVSETGVLDSGAVYLLDYIAGEDFALGDESAMIGAGGDPFSDGDGNQFDASGGMAWSDTTNLPDGHWLDGVDIGAHAYGEDKYYLSLLGVDGAYYWPSAPETIAVTGVDNAVFDASGIGKTFATKTLALAAMATLADDTYLFAGAKSAALYSVDMSAQAARIKRIVGD